MASSESSRSSAKVANSSVVSPASALRSRFSSFQKRSVSYWFLPVKIKFGKREFTRWPWELANPRHYWSGRQFLRLLKCLVLPFAEAVSAAPGHIMGRQKRTQIRRVNVECISAAHDPSCCTRIAIRNAKPSALVVYEPVKRDFSFRTEIKAHRVQFWKRPKLFAACLHVGC